MYLEGFTPAAVRSAALALVFTAAAAAQISGLCNTGKTPATNAVCAALLLPVTATTGGQTPSSDQDWEIAYPYPATISAVHGPCALGVFIRSVVQTPDGAWLANSNSRDSEWIMPDGGGNDSPEGVYVYRVKFPVPLKLASGVTPTGLTVNGQLASDNSMAMIYLESPAHSGSCSAVAGQAFPVSGANDYAQWSPFSFSNTLPLVAGSDAYLYFVVGNGGGETPGGSPTGLRVEFFSSSTFH